MKNKGKNTRGSGSAGGRPGTPGNSRAQDATKADRGPRHANGRAGHAAARPSPEVGRSACLRMVEASVVFRQNRMLARFRACRAHVSVSLGHSEVCCLLSKTAIGNANRVGDTVDSRSYAICKIPAAVSAIPAVLRRGLARTL